MTMSVFQGGVLVAGVLFLIFGGSLAVIAARIANAGRAAQAEAAARLAATNELAGEVKRLAEKVEVSLQYRDNAIENAFLRHNDACAASMHQTITTSQHSASGKGGHHDDDDDDHKKHKKHHSGGGHHDDDDDHHHKKKHSLSGGHHDDDDDHKKNKKHHSVDDERPSFIARLFGRAA